MGKEAALPIVERFERAQREPGFAWKESGGIDLCVIDGITFVPSHIERSLAEGRHTPSSRAAMFFLPLSLSAFYGAYSIWGEHAPLPLLLLLGGLASLAIGVAAARRSARNDAKLRDAKYVFRKGLYLTSLGAHVVQGQGRDDDDFSFYERGSIDSATLVRSGRLRRTKLLLRDGQTVFAHALDVRAIIGDWLAREA